MKKTDQEERVDEQFKVRGHAKLAGIAVNPEGELQGVVGSLITFETPYPCPPGSLPPPEQQLFRK
jgi:hypothetical protein